MRDIKMIACPRQECSGFEKKGEGNIVYFGHEKSGMQRYKCNLCGHVFVESKNTIFYHRHLSHDQIIEVLRNLSLFKSFREIADKLSVHHDTIDDMVDKFIQDVPALNKVLVDELKMIPLEIERFWIAILKHKRKISDKVKDAIKQVIQYEDGLRREGKDIRPVNEPPDHT